MYWITQPEGWVLYSDTYRGEYALNASFPEPWLNDFIQFNFEYEFAKAGDLPKTALRVCQLSVAHLIRTGN